MENFNGNPLKDFQFNKANEFRNSDVKLSTDKIVEAVNNSGGAKPPTEILFLQQSRHGSNIPSNIAGAMVAIRDFIDFHAATSNLVHWETKTVTYIYLEGLYWVTIYALVEIIRE